jgi:hypothetical protein
LLIATVRDYAIFALDPQGYIRSWNTGAERFKGYQAHEIIGKHFSVFYPEEDRRAHKPERELVIAAAEGKVEDEGWRVRKDGSRFWANVVITALRSEDGALVGFGKVTRDLTERRNAEEALRASEERFRLMVQNVRDYGIFMLDPEGRIISWNEGASRINGYTEEEVLGRHFSLFYTLEDQHAGKPDDELAIAAREGQLEDEGWRVRKDGTLFWSNVIITALRDESGRLAGFGKVTRDLTERRAAEQKAVEDARRMAEVEAASRAKSGFLAALSHELRTPLNAIGGYVDLLLLNLRGPINDEQRSDLERIRRSQQHLLGLINDLLNFSRVEAGRLDYDLRPVPVGEAIDAVCGMVEAQAAAKPLHLECASGDKHLTVYADSLKLEQILLNLVSNAMKFTPPGGRIEVGYRSSAPMVEITVRDSGVGVPADQLEAIFEPFVQVGRSWSNIQEGAGLGLSISRELARAMGGDLRVESTPGEGSTFTLVLPTSPPDSSTSPAPRAG